MGADKRENFIVNIFIMNKQGVIEAVDSKEISESDLLKIHEIEQDMWAWWIWEYVKCEDCLKIFWKEDIYWNYDKELRSKTVLQIERILWIELIDCPCCSWKTNKLWGLDYIDEIRERYKEELSYLTLYRDNSWEIRWFADWYISSFEKIYKREFSGYYNLIWIDEIRRIIEKELWNIIPKELFVWSSIWIEENYRSFFVLFNMIRELFYSIDDSKNNILWIAESELWTNTHSIFQTVWAKWIWMNGDKYKNQLWNKNSKGESDIFIHMNSVEDYKREFSVSIREFLKKHLPTMKTIIMD